MDEIQRWLKASLDTDPAERAREDWFDNLPTTPGARSFWLRVAVEMSRTEPWWYDTLVEYARRCCESDGRIESPALPGVFVNWCVGVAGKEIERPKWRGGSASPQAIDSYRGFSTVDSKLHDLLRLCSLGAESNPDSI